MGGLLRLDQGKPKDCTRFHTPGGRTEMHNREICGITPPVIFRDYSIVVKMKFI